MNADTLIVAGIVLCAVAFLLRRVIKSRRRAHGGPGCDNCGH